MTAILLLGIAILGIARARHRPAALITTKVAVVGLIAIVLYRGPRIWEWPATIFDALLAVVIGVLILDGIGLPTGLARRTGVGLRSKAWEYDVALTNRLSPLNDRLESAPSHLDINAYERWAAETADFGRQTLGRVRRMRAPDRAWEDLTRRYVSIYERYISALEGRMASNATFDPNDHVAVTRIREELRKKYRAEAAAILDRHS